MKMSNFVLILGLMLLIVAAQSGAAERPNLLSYQGSMTDSTGTPLTETLEMVFVIFLDSAGSEALWEENHESVEVVDGLFSVILGTTTTLDPDMFLRSPLWLGIRTEYGWTDPFLPMVGSGHSIRAWVSDRSEFAYDIAANTITSAKIVNGAIQLLDIGQNGATDGQVMAWQDGAGWTMVDAASGAGDITAVNTLTGSGLTGGGISGDLSLSIATNGIMSFMIGTGQVQSSDIADNSINSLKIITGSINSSDLNSNSVTGDKIADGAIRDADIYASAEINPSKIAGTAATLTTTQNFNAIKNFVYNTGMGTTTPGTHKLYVKGILNGTAGSTVFIENTGSAGLGLIVDNTSTDLTMLLSQHGTGDILRCDSWQGGWHPVFKVRNDAGIWVKGGATGYAAEFLGNVAIKKTDGTLLLELGDGLDYAEGFDVSNESEVKPGMVLVIDPHAPGQLAQSTQAYDRKVAGIVAGANNLGSGIRLGAGQFDHDVALAGRVYCYVDASFGAIELGDLLTTSPTPGHAMVVKDYTKAQGAILGKAMETMPEGESGKILVLVTLQ